ncbi:MAG: hypothetical protein Athens071425_547 [Parcubacteria group bacterium Athens0714_25]|nr:MAG: hypothetical protein Athens071425_547 [Parcubacteria group bacterium Athens0714_25]
MKKTSIIAVLLIAVFLGGRCAVADDAVVEWSNPEQPQPEILFDLWGDGGEKYAVTISVRDIFFDNLSVEVDGEFAISGKSRYLSDFSVVLPEVGKKYDIKVRLFDKNRKEIFSRSEKISTPLVEFETCYCLKKNDQIMVVCEGNLMVEDYIFQKISLLMGEDVSREPLVINNGGNLFVIASFTKEEFRKIGSLPVVVNFDEFSSEPMVLEDCNKK